MMTCDRCREAMGDYDHEDEAVQAMVDAHIGSCSACRQDFEERQEILAMMHEISIQVPVDFCAGVVGQVADAEQASRRVADRALPVLLGLLASQVLVLVIVRTGVVRVCELLLAGGAQLHDWLLRDLLHDLSVTGAVWVGEFSAQVPVVPTWHYWSWALLVALLLSLMTLIKPKERHA